MSAILWESLLNELLKVWVPLFGLYFAVYKGWKLYLESEIAKAKEQSVGEQALKIIETDIKAIEKEINNIPKLRILVERLRDDYKFIMDRLFPIKPISNGKDTQ